MIIARGPTGTSSSQDLLLLITKDVRGQTWHTIQAGYQRGENITQKKGAPFSSMPLGKHGTTATGKDALERLHAQK